MKQIWNKEACKLEALKYIRRVDFQKRSPGAYASAFKNKWLNEICAHMPTLRISWENNKEAILKKALKYNSLRQFQLNAPGAYKAADKLDILSEIKSLMPVYIPGSDKILPIETVKKRIFEIHGDLIEIIDSTYKGTNKKAIFKDKTFGEWEARPSLVLRGSSHPKRSKEKFKRTSLKKWGTEHPMQNEELKAKKESTILKIYGVKNVSSNKKIQAKKAKTTLKNFGTHFSAQSKIIMDKIKKTNIKRYGVEICSQNKEIALKQAKSSNIHAIRKHWNTNQELVCVGSYEIKTVDYLNEKQMNYEWQPKIFVMPNGKTYRPDFYLIDSDVWVEIKGYMRKDAQEKWDWFKSENPTAELWDRKKLKEIGIL